MEKPQTASELLALQEKCLQEGKERAGLPYKEMIEDVVREIYEYNRLVMQR